jgi:hypothetical protein
MERDLYWNGIFPILAILREIADMKNPCFTMAIAAVCLLGLAESVAARVFPGGGESRGGARAQLATAAINNRDSHYGDYGDYGGAVYVFGNNSPTSIGMQQGPSGPAFQPGLTAPMPSRSPGPSQAQANQDWFFQYQGQGSQAKGGAWATYNGPELSVRANAYYNAAAQDIGFEAARNLPRASLDIIKWPTLLRLPTFASRRAMIEAPYRRSPPGLSTPTADDYRAMAKTAAEMKAMLEWLSQDGLPTNSYEEAKKFLDQLQQEARDRSEDRGSSPTPKP